MLYNTKLTKLKSKFTSTIYCQIKQFGFETNYVYYLTICYTRNKYDHNAIDFQTNLKI